MLRIRFIAMDWGGQDANNLEQGDSPMSLDISQVGSRSQRHEVHEKRGPELKREFLYYIYI